MSAPAKLVTSAVKSRIVGYGDEAPDQLLANPLNYRRHPNAQREALRGSLAELGWIKGVIVNRTTGNIIDGHARVEEALRLGLQTIPVEYVELSAAEERVALAVLDPITEMAFRDDKALADLLADVTVEDPQLAAMLDEMRDAAQKGAAEQEQQAAAGKLSEKFGIAPFSVLNAREGWWQERKRAWLDLGLQSEVGRGENLLQFSETVLKAQGKGKGKKRNEQLTPEARKSLGFYESYKGGTLERAGGGATGTSIFDPVLCELVYSWFSPRGGVILDPFAGGSVRGVVASRLERSYVGIDLRAEQVKANEEQAAKLCKGLACQPSWRCGDSRDIPTLAGQVDADLVFSCPPYADLEVYSNDPRDLSTMDYGTFLATYREIIAKACARLKPDSFACFVVGDVRDRQGAYRNFVGDTVEAFRDAGMQFYNEAILVTAVGSLAMRAGRVFSATRKLGKTHQNVLVFLKGDAKAATARLGDCDFGLPLDGDGSVEGEQT